MSCCPSIPAVHDAEAVREEMECSQEIRGAREGAEREKEKEEGCGYLSHAHQVAQEGGGRI